jgi:2-hydroxychromene-2-carboxylate isomerase
MSRTIDYYFAAQSPWTYLGHDRFVALARAHGATVRVLPADYGERAPQRQAYRLVELRRFSEALGVPMNIQPKFFPVAGDDASRLIIAVDIEAGSDAALAFCGAVFRACWLQERDIANADVLAELLARQGLPAQCLERSRAPEVLARYARNTQQAIDAGVFGAPSYVIDGEIFWGQDRLDFVERKLKQ